VHAWAFLTEVSWYRAGLICRNDASTTHRPPSSETPHPGRCLVDSGRATGPSDSGSKVWERARDCVRAYMVYPVAPGAMTGERRRSKWGRYAAGLEAEFNISK
jgi:hypothetical protein